jgi:REP element-mobilizing transposase RayT
MKQSDLTGPDHKPNLHPMARLLRVQFPGAIYHVSARGNERRLIFGDDRDRARFLAKLAESKELYSVRLFLVCLMPNHFHLLLGTPGGNLSQCLGRLMTAYSVYFNKGHHRAGHLTQGRFAAQLVEGNEYLLKLSRYIHLNPVCGKRWKGGAAGAAPERIEELCLEHLPELRWAGSRVALRGLWACARLGGRAAEERLRHLR